MGLDMLPVVKRIFFTVFALSTLIFWLPITARAGPCAGTTTVEEEVIVDPKFRPQTKLVQGPWRTCYGFAATMLLETLYNSIHQEEAPVGLSPLSVLGWACDLDLQKALNGGAPHFTLFKIRDKALHQISTHSELPYEILYRTSSLDRNEVFKRSESRVMRRITLPNFNIVVESIADQKQAEAFIKHHFKQSQDPSPLAFSQAEPSHSRVANGYRKLCCGSECEEQVEVSNWSERGLDAGWIALENLKNLAEFVSIHPCSESASPLLPPCDPLFVSSQPLLPIMDLDQSYEDLFLAHLPRLIDPKKIDSTLNAPGPLGFTPIIAAAHHGNSRVLKSMIDTIKNHHQPLDLFLEKQNEGGFTALGEAVFNTHYDAVMELLEAGANPCIRGHDGRSTLDLAEHPRFFSAGRPSGDKLKGNNALENEAKLILAALKFTIRSLKRDVRISKVNPTQLTPKHQACSDF